MRVEIKEPCPFCGSTDIRVVGSKVECWNCGATGPDAFNKEEAIDWWNESLAGGDSYE